LAALSAAVLGRSHRSKLGKARLKEVLDRSRAILGIPDDYLIGIVPASDTGAVEMALWSLLGPRPVDLLAWESFGEGWVSDVAKQLKLEARKLIAAYGTLPDLAAVDPSHDVVFTWNGTTSGVRVPNADWVSDAREGLTICDATSAAFAMALPWPKLDVVTWSWQKVLGGEAAHGMLVLSPRAVARLESYSPPWPLPKIFRMTKGGKLIDGIFLGETINTPSMLAVEDAVDGLKWAESIGGLPALIARTERNFAAISAFVARTPWLDFLCNEPAARSTTSVCLVFSDPAITALSADEQAAFAKAVVAKIEGEKAGVDLGAYRDAPPGLRIWGGATVETSDLEALFPWIEWAYGEALKARSA
jgi:phosphoserine aminotransferase